MRASDLPALRAGSLRLRSPAPAELAALPEPDTLAEAEEGEALAA